MFAEDRNRNSDYDVAIEREARKYASVVVVIAAGCVYTWQEAIMLNRQRVILELLRIADRPVTRLELTKWSFLIRHETESSGGSAFYDFLPYRFGPFSFSLYQELDKLVATSYVVDDKKSVRLSSTALSLPPLTQGVRADIQRIVRRIEKFSASRLIDYVYSNYPSYTCNSELKQLTKRPIASLKVYTAGYEGRSVDSFLNLLVQSGITRLVDVRMNPIARRYGFHRSTLDRLCGNLGIDYRHIPSLGIRSEKRQSLETSEDYAELFDDYEKTTLSSESDSIESVRMLISERPSVLVCMEADPECCHRTRLAKEVSRRSQLPIEHLGFPND